MDADPEIDRRHMQRALTLAARGWGRVAPNPLVGAVVVRDGQIVGEGFHAEYGGPHAEVAALRAAGEHARGATLYVTLEPCAHHGKTPPCTDAVTAAGVRRLVFAAADPNPKASGGAEVLRREGVEVTGGIEADAARDQNAAFFHAWSEPGTRRPWTVLKLALSLDGCIADRSGDSHWITSAEARAEVHRLRAGFDAIAVGIGTVLADDPRLTVRGAIVPQRPPVRVVFDRELRLPAASQLVRSAGEVPVWAVAAPDPDPARRATLEAAGVRILTAASLADGLKALRDAGLSTLFCEGGAQVSAALLAGEQVDQLHLFYAPLFLGPEALSPFGMLGSAPISRAHRWRHLRSEVFGPDTLVTLAR